MDENTQYNGGQMNPNNQNPSGDQPGKGAAIASLVCGLVAVICWFFGWSAIASVVLGIVGLVLAASAKKAGYTGGMRTAGFILSIIGLIVGAIVLLACVACVGGALGTAGAITDGVIEGAVKSLE